MKSKLLKKSLIISSAVLLVGAAVAFAHGGNGGYGGPMMGYGGYGGPMMGYNGYGGHMMGYGGGHMRGYYGGGPMMGFGYGPQMRGYGYGPNLSPEQAAKLDQARERFFKDTSALREKIDENRFALRIEFNKENPDAAKVKQLQKELSQLEGQFDQKAVQFRLEMRKLLPEDARVRGFGPGPGGYCW